MVKLIICIDVLYRWSQTGFHRRNFFAEGGLQELFAIGLSVKKILEQINKINNNNMIFIYELKKNQIWSDG